MVASTGATHCDVLRFPAVWAEIGAFLDGQVKGGRQPLDPIIR